MIKLLFSGDFAPIIQSENIGDQHFTGITDIISSADLHITNLECPLTSSKKPIDKTGPSIKSDPVAVTLLQQAKVNIGCLANNHIFDYGEQGIKETIKVCESNNIDTLGIVAREDKRDHWLIKEVRGKKVGFLNYCEHEFSVRGKGLMGACGYDPIEAFYEVGHLKHMVDYLIVIYHGGNEYYPLPRPDLKKDFHYLADLGADAVIGHHTHVFSGYEIYNLKPLIYSLGNFFFPYDGEPESWHEGILCQLKIENTIEIEFMPVLQCKKGFEVIKMSKDKGDSLMNTIEILSNLIRNEEELQKKWDNYVSTIGDGLSNQILFTTRFDKALLKVPILKNYSNNKNRWKAILNILRCRSLEQLLIDNLKSNQCL